MTIFPGFTLAVPSVMLRRGITPPSLNIAGGNWHHLSSYVDSVDQMPALITPDNHMLAPVLENLQAAVRHFGTTVITDETLQRADRMILPERPFVAMLWWVRMISIESQRVIELLQSCGSDDTTLDVLRELGEIAARVRNYIQPLSISLTDSLRSVIVIHHELEIVFQQLSVHSQKIWESVGSHQVQLTHLNDQILKLGMFRYSQYKKLQVQRSKFISSLSKAKMEAENTQALLSALEPVILHGAWLKAALEELRLFFESSRSAWTSFGSGCSQMMADLLSVKASDVITADDLLDRKSAIADWSSLVCAALCFSQSAQSLPLSVQEI